MNDRAPAVRALARLLAERLAQDIIAAPSRRMGGQCSEHPQPRTSVLLISNIQRQISVETDKAPSERRGGNSQA